MPSLAERFNKKWIENPETGCWEWTAGRSSTGYGVFDVAGSSRGAHRFSYELNIGPIGEGLCVCHRCDNRKCVRPDHLFLGSYADNMRDMGAKGRKACQKGSNNNLARLTEDEVRLIKAALPRLGHGGQRFLARWFGVTHETIYDIRAGRNWAHV